MGNISFSEIGEAILSNKALVDHISHRMANLTREESLTGELDIHLKDGNILTFKFGASGTVNNLKSKDSVNSSEELKRENKQYQPA